jgi:hypothetical protein
LIRGINSNWKRVVAEMTNAVMKTIATIVVIASLEGTAVATDALARSGEVHRSADSGRSAEGEVAFSRGAFGDEHFAGERRHVRYLHLISAPYQIDGDARTPDQSCVPFNGVHPRPLPNVC